MRFRRRSDAVNEFTELLRDACDQHHESCVDVETALADICRRTQAAVPPLRRRRHTRRLCWMSLCAAGALLLLIVCVAVHASVFSPAEPQAPVAGSLRRYMPAPTLQPSSPPSGAGPDSATGNTIDGSPTSLTTLPVTTNTPVRPSTGPVSLGDQDYVLGWRIDVSARVLRTATGLSFTYALPADGSAVRLDAVIGVPKTAQLPTACKWSLSTDNSPDVVRRISRPGQAERVRLPLTRATVVRVTVVPAEPGSPSLSCAMGDPRILRSAPASTPAPHRAGQDPTSPRPAHGTPRAARTPQETGPTPSVTSIPTAMPNPPTPQARRV